MRQTARVECEEVLVDCLVCGDEGTRQVVFLDKASVKFRRCGRCGFELINPRPTSRWLDAHYRNLGTSYFIDPFKVKSDFAPDRYALELRLLGRGGGRLLDVGCMTGAFVHAASKAGFRASGIDLCAPAVEFGKREFGLDLVAGDFLTMPYKPGSFDVVTLWATLEHLPEPEAFVRRALTLLSPSGALAITVPNHSGLTQRVLGGKNRYVCVEHLNYFTARTISRFLRRCGFWASAIWRRHFSPVPFLVDLFGKPSRVPGVSDMLRHQSYTDSVKRRAWLRPVKALHAGVEAVISWCGAGDLMMVLARPV